MKALLDTRSESADRPPSPPPVCSTPTASRSPSPLRSISPSPLRSMSPSPLRSLSPSSVLSNPPRSPTPPHHLNNHLEKKRKIRTTKQVQVLSLGRAPSPLPRINPPKSRIPLRQETAQGQTNHAPRPTNHAHRPTNPAPRPTNSATKTTNQTPRPTITAPRPTMTAPRLTNPATRPTITAPRPTITAPRTTNAATRPTNTAPVNNHEAATRPQQETTSMSVILQSLCQEVSGLRVESNDRHQMIETMLRNLGTRMAAMEANQRQNGTRLDQMNANAPTTIADIPTDDVQDHAFGDVPEQFLS